MKKIALSLLVAGASLMAADGAALYKKCAACHGANAEKAALGKSAVIQGMDAATIATSLKGYKAGTLNKNGMGALMKGQVASYSDADIEAVAAYVAGLK
ncbi:MAG: c-type cytochrome [Campylobacterales bacterium]|nr:c-type cytochrome [Campylobacterales bacterium]